MLHQAVGGGYSPVSGHQQRSPLHQQHSPLQQQQQQQQQKQQQRQLQTGPANVPLPPLPAYVTAPPPAAYGQQQAYGQPHLSPDQQYQAFIQYQVGGGARAPVAEESLASRPTSAAAIFTASLAQFLLCT